MAKMPTPEENAHRILEIFSKFEMRPGEVLPPGAVLTNWIKMVSARTDDLNNGLQYAVEHGWITQKTDEKYELTETGFEMM